MDSNGIRREGRLRLPNIGGLRAGGVEALSRLRSSDLGPKACVGAGTGLGECFLTKSSLRPELRYECYPSEDGHADFVPRGPLEVDLLNYLNDGSCLASGSRNRLSLLFFDRPPLLSGRPRGLRPAGTPQSGPPKLPEIKVRPPPSRLDGARRVWPRAGQCVRVLRRQVPGEEVDPIVHAEFLGAGDQQGRVVGVNSGKEGSLAAKAAEVIFAAYGAKVGNVMLKFIPTGGMYVTGGLVAKNVDKIAGKDGPFMEAYLDKGRLNPLLETVPLFLVLTEDIGLRGARVCAERESAPFVFGVARARAQSSFRLFCNLLFQEYLAMK
ncbi:hypothetical protein ACHAWF_006109 [Thalassiosira exigua]